MLEAQKQKRNKKIILDNPKIDLIKQETGLNPASC